MGQKIRRITVEEVRDAMKKTGIKLKRNVTRGTEGGSYCGCPIGIIAAATSDTNVETKQLYNLMFCSHFIGLSEEYRIGFVAGFDNTSSKKIAGIEEPHMTGYSDGLAVASALLSKSDNR